MQLIIEISFWALTAVIIYTYVGYALLLYALVKLKKLFSAPIETNNESYRPNVTLLIAAYNEEDFIQTKIENSLQLDYPKDKLNIQVVTDGSTDKTVEIVESTKGIIHHHLDERKGKLAAVDRIIPLISDEIIVFSDANTLLNKEAILEIVKHYQNPRIGVVSGEKRILNKDKDAAAGAGEGFYWRYESKLKKWDFELYSAVGAAGELFSIRKDLHVNIPPDSIIEDFTLSMKIASKGHIIAYEPNAYALETASASSGEEMKRKVRIAAGGIQSIFRFANLLNPFKYGWLSFQFMSHRVLRWSIAPLSLMLMIPLGVLAYPYGLVYQLLFWCQLAFYLAAFMGYLLQARSIKLKPFFIPYYFLMMNYAVIRGFFRFLSGSQTVLWEKAKRAESTALKNAGSQ